jgi:adenosine deaminase
VRGALEALQAERIGHGTRAAEEPALLEEIARRGAALELCPLSNLRTGVIRRLEEHPIRVFQAAGLRLCVNSDDPVMFNSSLADEHQALMETCGFSRAEIRALVLGAVDCCWLPDAERAALAAACRDRPGWGEEA